jgi:hypothetical protein
MRLLRGLAGRVLSCGCLVGVYETYTGEVISTIDARGLTCSDAAHRLHTVVAPLPVPPDPTAAFQNHSAGK